jgi:hypothetical protein
VYRVELLHPRAAAWWPIFPHGSVTFSRFKSRQGRARSPGSRAVQRRWFYVNMMFHEFCHALELIEKSGKNGAKQRNLDVLWEKVRAAVCQAAIGVSLTRDTSCRMVAPQRPAISS